MEMKVEPGRFVEFAYTLYDANSGEVLFSTEKKHPDMMVFGVSREIVPGLSAAMEGLKAGDRFETVLPPSAAFGDLNPDLVLELDREIFEQDGKLSDKVKIDAVLPMMTAEGYRVNGKVLNIGKKIKMDFNHPFAGMTVRYEGTVVTVREATEEELHPAHGCGGCCGSCGDSKDGGCGSGCGDDKEGGCCGGC